MIANRRRTLRPAACFALSTVIAAACSRGPAPVHADSTTAQPTPVAGADTSIMIRGAVASISPTSVVITTDSGSVTVALPKPLQLYDREPGTLTDVKENSFIGVTSVKQPDGTEKATEIHVFAEDLRGLGEGSRMMTADTGGNRMTNGAVSGSRMTNGAVSPARMSNGSVASASGSTYVVKYAGGSQTVTVPPNTPVTELKATTKTLAVGDQVYIMARKAADGSLSAQKALLTNK
jgi:Domain of unknown function (DUF5666)